MHPANTITVGSVRAVAGPTFAKRRCTDLRSCSQQTHHSNRNSERCPDHFPGASCPADILLRFLHGNREIVFACVASLGSAGRTSGDPVPSNFAPHLDVVQNPKLSPFLRVVPLSSPLWRIRRRTRSTNCADHRSQLVL